MIKFLCILLASLTFLTFSLNAEEQERLLYDITDSQDVNGKFPDKQERSPTVNILNLSFMKEKYMQKGLAKKTGNCF